MLFLFNYKKMQHITLFFNIRKSFHHVFYQNTSKSNIMAILLANNSRIKASQV